MCVLTRREAIPVLRSVLVAPVTRTVRDIPSEVRLNKEDGMAGECAISLDNVRTVPRGLLIERITSLSGTRMHEVCQALAAATGCR